MRKVCVVVGSRANYSSIKSALRAIQDHPDLAGRPRFTTAQRSHHSAP